MGFLSVRCFCCGGLFVIGGCCFLTFRLFFVLLLLWCYVGGGVCLFVVVVFFVCRCCCLGEVLLVWVLFVCCCFLGEEVRGFVVVFGGSVVWPMKFVFGFPLIMTVSLIIVRTDRCSKAVSFLQTSVGTHIAPP